MERKIIICSAILLVGLLNCYGDQSNLDCAVEVFVEAYDDMYGNMTKTIRCGMAYDIPDVDIVELSLLAYDSCTDLDTYTPVAHVDFWTQDPRLDSDNTVSRDVSGSINQFDDALSFLSVSQPLSGVSDPDLIMYRCVAQGYDKEGKPITASESVKDRITQNVTYPDEVTLIETISMEVDNVSRKLENAAEQIDNYHITDSFHEQNYAIKDVGDKLQVLTTNLADTASSVSNKMEEMNADVGSKLGTIQTVIEEFRTKDSLNCNRNEILDALSELNANVNAQMNIVHQEILSVESDNDLQHESNAQLIDTLSNQLVSSSSGQSDELKKLNDSMDTLSNEITGLDDSIAVLDVEVAGINGSVHVLDTFVNELDNNTKLLNVRLVGLGEKVELIDTTVMGINDNMGVLDTKIIELDNNLGLVNTTVKGLDDQVQVLDAKTKELDDKTGELDHKMVGLDGKMGEIGTSLTGLDGKTGTLDTTVKSVKDKSEILDTNVKGLDDKIGVLDGKVTEVDNKAGTLDTKLKGLGEKQLVLETSVKTNDEKLRALDAGVMDLQTQIQTISSKLEELKEIDSKLQTMTGTSWTSQFTFSHFYVPDASHIYKDKLYLFSKFDAIFDIYEASAVCQEYGGNLVEFEDQEEYNFINDLMGHLSRTDNQNKYFFVGYTDSLEETKFVHFYSGKALTVPDMWDEGEPNNNGGQDCVQIWHNRGLHDIACNHPDRYICEVPYPF